MSLENLIGRSDDNLAVKPFVALLWEYSHGNMTAEDVVANVNKMLIKPMVVDDEIDVAELIKKLDGAEDKTDFLLGLLLTLCLSEYNKTIISNAELKTRYDLR
jgi:hypothetical protein